MKYSTISSTMAMTIAIPSTVSMTIPSPSAMVLKPCKVLAETVMVHYWSLFLPLNLGKVVNAWLK